MSQGDERDSTVPPPLDEGEDDSSLRSRPKKLVERLIKRGLESGIDAFSKSEDAVRSVVDNIKHREITSLALEQIDETKNGVYRAVAKEIRDFLENTSLATELKKALTGLAFEVKMEVRFKATEDEATGKSSIRPSVEADVSLKEKPKK